MRAQLGVHLVTQLGRSLADAARALDVSTSDRIGDVPAYVTYPIFTGLMLYPAPGEPCDEVRAVRVVTDDAHSLDLPHHREVEGPRRVGPCLSICSVTDHKAT